MKTDSIRGVAVAGIKQRANFFTAYLLMPRKLALVHLPDANSIERPDVQRLTGPLRVKEWTLLDHL